MLEELVTNGSFENGAYNNASAGLFGVMDGDATTITGWRVFGTSAGPPAPVIWVDNRNSFDVQTLWGQRFLDLTGYRDDPRKNPGGVKQTIATKPERSYRIVFFVGASDKDPQFTNRVAVHAVVQSGGHTVLNTIAVNPGFRGNYWWKHLYTFRARGTSTELIFQGIGGNAYIGLDNVSVRWAIPFVVLVVDLIHNTLRRIFKGLAAGLAGAWALTRFMQSMLFGVTGTDALTFGVVATLLAAVAVVATFIPARRAARIDPIVALRAD